MTSLHHDTPDQVAAIAARHGVSSDAANQLLAALSAGGGRQAQFNHPELGGMGQWSAGGMTMVGDMFNQPLKARVAALCSELADLARQSPPPGKTPDHPAPDARVLARPGIYSRWPEELGAPASSGSQNDMHYAIFPAMRRLGVEDHGQVTIYDTGDHRIGGVSQQQSGEATLQFTSQSGPVRLSDLAVVPQ